MRSMERWSTKEKHGGGERDHYSLEPNRFRLACDEFLVPREAMRDAHSWVDTVAQAANEAPDQVRMEARAKYRRQRDDED